MQNPSHKNELRENIIKRIKQWGEARFIQKLQESFSFLVGIVGQSGYSEPLSVRDHMEHMVEQKLASVLVPYCLNLFGCRLEDYAIRANLAIAGDIESSYDLNWETRFDMAYNYQHFETLGFKTYLLYGGGEEIIEGYGKLPEFIKEIIAEDVMEMAEYCDFSSITILYHPNICHFERWVETNKEKLSLEFKLIWPQVKLRLNRMAPYSQSLKPCPDGSGGIYPLYFTDGSDGSGYDCLESEYCDDSFFAAFAMYCLMVIAERQGYYAGGAFDGGAWSWGQGQG